MESQNSSGYTVKYPETKQPHKNQPMPAWTLDEHKLPAENLIKLVVSLEDTSSVLPDENEETAQSPLDKLSAQQLSEWDTPSASTTGRKNTTSDFKSDTMGGNKVAIDSSSTPSEKPTLE
ncbi:hypothetical protein PM082_009436 [Marasmius tenuissimus]|nr:hypothetical protein PM082_009436 [Marasmius tenuissimus]